MTDDAPSTFSLNGISESDWARWKHHPVTKVYVRYLMDYANMLRRDQLAKIEQSEVELPPKAQGEYKGRVLTLDELASLEFAHVDQFYASGEEQDAEGDA